MTIVKEASAKKIEEVLKEFNEVFSPSLYNQIGDFGLFSNKLAEKSEFFLALGEEKEIIGFIAFYANDVKEFFSYISLIAVKVQNKKLGIGSSLINQCISYSRKRNLKKIRLEVNTNNIDAISFYKHFGFRVVGDLIAGNDSLFMELEL